MRNVMKLITAALSLFVFMSATCLPILAVETTPSPVAYYSFEDSTNLGKDFTANANDLSAVKPEGITSAEGITGKALSLAGTSGLIAPYNPSDGTDFVDHLSNGYTISFYAKTTQTEVESGTNHRIISNGIEGSARGEAFIINLLSEEDGTKFLRCHTVIGDSDWWGMDKARVYNDLQGWHHYVLVYDPNVEDTTKTITTMIDGVVMDNAYSEDADIISDFSFCIGGSWAPWDWFNGGDHSVVREGFHGLVDEVKIFDSAIYSLEDMGVITDEMKTLTVSDDVTLAGTEISFSDNGLTADELKAALTPAAGVTMKLLDAANAEVAGTAAANTVSKIQLYYGNTAVTVYTVRYAAAPTATPTTGAVVSPTTAPETENPQTGDPASMIFLSGIIITAAGTIAAKKNFRK